ncbi:MAG: ABC transporter ATP-binding protein/permease [Rickettsiales bacterium]|nr:ABC transporter ATP-binding protein/permease [Rickettsiales bacterium]
MALIFAFISPKLYQYVVKFLEESFKSDIYLNIVDILLLCLPIFLIKLFNAFLNVISFWTDENFSIKFRSDAKENLVSYSLLHSHDFYKTRHSGALVGKLDQIINQSAQIIVKGIFLFPVRFFSVIFAIIALSTVSWISVVIVVIASIFFGIVNYIYAKKWRRVSEESDSMEANISGDVADVFGNIATVRNNGQEDKENRFLNKRFIDLNKLRQQINKRFTYLDFSIFSGWGMVESVFLFLSVYIATETRSLNEYTLILSAGGVLLNTINRFVGELQTFQKNVLKLRPILNEVFTPYDIVDSKGAKDLKVTKGEIRFQNVSFKHSDGNGDVLKNFNLTIKPGQSVALVGESGSGKTTMANLIIRTYDPGSGKILIDGQDIKNVKLKSLRKSIAFILQDPQMFRRTIKENIAYGVEKASMSDIIKASKQAQIHDFIMGLPKKYDTLIGERGINLSGGQRQRVAIARAFLKKTKILILDEATSSLDMQTEKFIRDSLKKIFKGKTVVMITHRLASAQKVDRIISLDKGKIVEDGTHNSLLLNKNGVYAKLLKAEKER